MFAHGVLIKRHLGRGMRDAARAARADATAWMPRIRRQRLEPASRRCSSDGDHEPRSSEQVRHDILIQRGYERHADNTDIEAFRPEAFRRCHHLGENCTGERKPNIGTTKVDRQRTRQRVASAIGP